MHTERVCVRILRSLGFVYVCVCVSVYYIRGCVSCGTHAHTQIYAFPPCSLSGSVVQNDTVMLVELDYLSQNFLLRLVDE